MLTPDTVTKFLYSLTYDKTVKYVFLCYNKIDNKLNLHLSTDALCRRQNLEVKLREQYLERNPKRNPFGTDIHPRLWGELGLSQKVSLANSPKFLALYAHVALWLSVSRSMRFIWSVNGSGRILKGSERS